MITLRNRAQKASIPLLVGSFFMVPILYNSYFEWKKLCEQLFIRTDTTQCIFFGPLSKYYTPYVIVTILMFVIGLLLLFLPAIRKRLLK